jgi:hypothetical protein
VLPEAFERKLREACGEQALMRARKDKWPDEPMEHGYAAPGMEGLKEYFGGADDVAEFLGDAEFGARILVHDPYIQLSADDVAAGVKLVGFESLLEEGRRYLAGEGPLNPC